MNIEAPYLTAMQLTRLAGCNPVTFRSWRNRNGLMADAHPPREAGNKSAHIFSPVEAVLVRAMVALVTHGFAADDAVKVVNDVLFQMPIKLMLRGEPWESDVVGVMRNTNTDTLHIIYRHREDTLGYFFEAYDEATAVTILNLREVVRHVIVGLADLKLSERGSNTSNSDEAPRD